MASRLRHTTQQKSDPGIVVQSGTRDRPGRVGEWTHQILSKGTTLVVRTDEIESYKSPSLLG